MTAMRSLIIDEDIIKSLLKHFCLDIIHMGQWSESARVEYSGETVYDWNLFINIVIGDANILFILVETSRWLFSGISQKNQSQINFFSPFVISQFSLTRDKHF